MTARSPTSSSPRLSTISLLGAVFFLLTARVCSESYYGKLIGKLPTLHHSVSGEVYAVDGRTLFIKDFVYDGEAPTAFFYVGSTDRVSGEDGVRLRDERGATQTLRRYRKEDITLTLPDNKTLNDIKWFSVWCDRFSVSFGDVRIPRGFDYPRPQKIGALSGVHGISSEPIVVVDSQTLLVPSFSYDGEAPDAKFWVGAGPSPSPQGIRVPDENGRTVPLRFYDRKTIVLTLPGDLTVHRIGHFGVWCEAFTVDFGHVQIPQNLNVPPSLKMLGVSPQNVHRGGQGQTVGLANLFEPSTSSSSSSSSPSSSTVFANALLSQQQPQRPTTYRPILRREDKVQTGRSAAQYGDDTTSLDEPAYQEHSRRTRPQPNRAAHHAERSRSRQIADEPQANSYARLMRFHGDWRLDSFSKLNCEVLEDRLGFEVRWAVAGDSIVAQLVGKLESGQYMAFGISADPERSKMVGGDVAVAWVDKQSLQGYAVDYFLESKAQCSGGRGSCPDTRIQENTNSIRLLNAVLVDGYSIVTYQRPLKANDELDLQILTNGSQAIIWAIGPLNDKQEVSFHSDYLKTDRFIDFGRPPLWNCPVPDQEQSTLLEDNADKVSGHQELTATTRRPQRAPPTPAPATKTDAWEIPPIQCNEPDDGVFYAQMGPTGGKHGYPAITGHVGWGISWYINGLLIPEINVVRGTKYTFVTEGGVDAETPARYHPFYITDDPIGGYQHKTPEEKAKVKIFAGAQRQRGQYRPTGVGRLCNWVPDPNQPPADEFSSFGAYQRTLTLVCERGDPGYVEWTPDENTPDTVYYQCFTHRYLGWKINVHDSCDAAEAASSASEIHEVRVAPSDEQQSDDLEGSPSIRVASKVTPTAEFLQQHLHHGEPGLRYQYHPSTNHGKLGASYTQLLTTANNNNNNHNNNNNNNNNYMRLQSPSSSSSSSYEDQYGTKSSYATQHRHLDEDLLQKHHGHHHHHHHHHQMSPVYRDQPMMGANRHAPPPGPYPPNRQQIVEIEQDLHQQPSNQQLSNLVADGPRPMNHGIKYVPQIVYSRPVSYHYANNYHHPYHHAPMHHVHHQPEQRTQLMLIKRPMMTRRPMPQNPHPQQSMARPVFLERKKAVYRPAASTYRRAAEKLIPAPQIIKLKKIEPMPSTKLEPKVSTVDVSNLFTVPLKPARNTGFNPDSIVIEGGFKPIIKTVDRPEDLAEKRISEEKEPPVQEPLNHRPVDSFEPVFIPSPPVPTVDTTKKSKKKTKLRPGDVDDMEMAADRTNAYYLPPVAGTGPKDPPGSPSGVLITFDGKRLKDSSLARSISTIDDYRGRLSSDVLSRTPQFGRFKGELPVSVPEEGRSEFDKRRISTDLSLPDARPRINTKLTLVSREKRSPHEGHVHGNVTGLDHHDHHGHHHHSNDSLLAGAGGTVLANFGCILLAVVLHRVI